MKYPIEHIERPGWLLSQFDPEDTIGKRRLDLRIVTECEGERGFAKASSTT